MRQAITSSQQQSFKLYQHGMQNTIYENSSNVVIDEMGNDSSIPLDFFTEINNF